MELKKGDLFFIKTNNKFYIYKIIEIDLPIEVYHCIVYKPFDFKPNNLSELNLQVFANHIPIEKPKEYTILGNVTVTNKERFGFYEYLKLTDFARYLKETNNTIENVVNTANNYFKNGNDYYLNNDFANAIKQYSLAIETYPLFFEAIDRRAFCKMAQGEYLDAIKDFEFSLSINPNSVVCEFAIGECYFYLKDYKKALNQFEHTLELFPEDQLTKDWILKTKEQL